MCEWTKLHEDKIERVFNIILRYFYTKTTLQENIKLHEGTKLHEKFFAPKVNYVRRVNFCDFKKLTLCANFLRSKYLCAISALVQFIPLVQFSILVNLDPFLYNTYVYIFDIYKILPKFNKLILYKTITANYKKCGNNAVEIINKEAYKIISN